MTQEPNDEEIQKLIAQKEALERQIQQALADKASTSQPTQTATAVPESKPVPVVATPPASPASSSKAFDHFDKEPLATLNAKLSLVNQLHHQISSEPMLFIARLENNSLSIPASSAPANVEQVNRFQDKVMLRCKAIFHCKDIDSEVRQLDSEATVIKQSDAQLTAKLTSDERNTPTGNWAPELYSESTANLIKFYENMVYSYIGIQVKQLRAQNKHPESMSITPGYLFGWLKGWGVCAALLLVVGLVKQDSQTFTNILYSAEMVIVLLVGLAIYGFFAAESAKGKLKSELDSKLHPAAKQIESPTKNMHARGGNRHPYPIPSQSFPNAWEAVSMALISTRHPNYGSWSVYLPARHLHFLKASWNFRTEFDMGGNNSTLIPQVIDLLVTFDEKPDGTCDIILDFETKSGGLNIFQSSDLDTLVELTITNVKQLAPMQLIV